MFLDSWKTGQSISWIPWMETAKQAWMETVAKPRTDDTANSTGEWLEFVPAMLHDRNIFQSVKPIDSWHWHHQTLTIVTQTIWQEWLSDSLMSYCMFPGICSAGGQVEQQALFIYYCQVLPWSPWKPSLALDASCQKDMFTVWPSICW